MSLNPNVCELAGTKIREVLNNNEQSTSTNKETRPDQESENCSSEVAIDECHTNPIRHAYENRIPEKGNVELFSNAVRRTCPDPLNMLTQNYEDQEPVTYFSGIVDHIMKSKSSTSETCAEEFSTTFSDHKGEFFVTDLMTNETIEHIFDKVYERGAIIENSDGKIFGCESSIHCNSTVNEGINSVREPNTRPTTFRSTLKRPSNDEASEKDVSPYKKPKRSITFDSVSVYYFPRTQGFTCIPSQGGSTLGMSWNHSYIRKFSLSEYSLEQRRAHKQYCAQQVSRNWNEISNMSSDDSDSEEIISDSELDYENYNFLQPIPTRERRAMLRAAGVHKIDAGEKDECRSIRLSREFCGCDCQVYCNPETCICAQAGVKCQVDRMNFPCSCSRDGCANVNGRVEFNPIRVRTHYLHTLMRLEMEKKKEEEEQRARLMLSGAEDLNPCAYSYSLPHNTNTGLINFSYNDLNTYYHQHQQQPPTQYVQSSSSVAANSCFNFNFSSSNGEFVLASTTYESMTGPVDSRLILKDAAAPSTMRYCSPVLPQSVDGHPAAPHYDNNSSCVEQGFVVHEITNSCSNGNVEEISYNMVESFVQVNKNYDQFRERQDENVSTYAEAEKEESSQDSEDISENLGDIIKKTMVETIIA